MRNLTSLTLGHIRTVLRRQLPVITPESMLWLSAILLAFSDAKVKSSTHRSDALNFFIDGRCELICDRIGINHEFVIECFHKYMEGERE